MTRKTPTVGGPRKINKLRVSDRGSTSVEGLEIAWSALREIEHAIPPAVLTLVDVRSRGRVKGYCAFSIWKKRQGSAHEIAISPKLIGHPKEILATMLHEAAHAVLSDAGRNGGLGSTRYYHTKEFRDQCQKFGLACEYLNTRYGFTLTSWPAGKIPPRFKPIIAMLRLSLPAGTSAPRRGGAIKPRPLPETGHTQLFCGCKSQRPSARRSVYVKNSVRVAGGVICLFCGREFSARLTAGDHPGE